MNETMHAVVQGSGRVALPGAKALGPANANEVIEVLIKVRRKKEIGSLDRRPDTAMSRATVGTDYGASAEDMELVVNTFRTFGLQVVDANAATRTVELSGSIAEVEKAFQVKLFNYEHPEGNYRGRVGDVFVPAALEDVVTGVFGLDDRRVARRRRHRVTHHSAPKELSSIPSTWYLPSELATRYAFPEGDGSGQTVGLLEFGGGYFASDLAQFCGLAKVSQPTVVPISVDKTSTHARDGAEGEVMLDVEVIAGVCPKSTIAVYFAHWSEKGWIKALDAAVHDTKNNPTVVSVSWGNPEDVGIWTGQAMNAVNETLKDAALAGITVCVSAGDDGSSDAYLDGHAHADFPASSPYVLAVGGTSISKKSAPLPDIVWFEGNGLRQDNNPNSGSTGGAVSAVFARPTWQESIKVSSVNPGAIVGRCIPDVAANADWTVSPYLLVVDGEAEPNGGTSASSPLVAAMIARINAKLNSKVGYLTPLLYESASGKGPALGAQVCTDVTEGNNVTAKVGGYDAQNGYDAASGWGTPNGTKLVTALAPIIAKGSASPGTAVSP